MNFSFRTFTTVATTSLPLLFGGNAALADSFVLIHGAWHDGTAWDGVRDELTAAGHSVSAPSMPGRADGGLMARDIMLTDYADAVATAVRDLNAETGEPVTLVAHSSGAFVMQVAAPQVTDLLEQIVVFQPIALGDGQAQTDLLPPQIADGLRGAAAAFDGMVPADEGFVRGALIAGNTAEEQDRVMALLVSEPIALFDTPIDAKPYAALEVPVASIRATADTSLPAGSYEAMAQALGAGDIVEIEGGHEALVIQPNAFAAALLELAADQ